MKAIIPAAGVGTRFLPVTKAQPKEMLPVVDRPAIQYVVEEALAAAASEVIIVSNDDKPSIVEHFSPAPELERYLADRGKNELAAAVTHAGSLPVSFVPQPEPLGLGHAVLCAAEKIGQEPPEPFFVLLGDVLVPDNKILPRMKEVSAAHGGASVIAVFRVPLSEVSRFGVIDGELVAGNEEGGSGVWRINALVEKPPAPEAPSALAIFGRYLLTPKVMELLVKTAPGAGGEIQLTDALGALLEHEELYAIEINVADGFDTGTIETWLDTTIRLALRNPKLAKVVKAAAGTEN
ncbi:MAG: NTP transferase domain-containing protein [Coriobacteriales bacterium]|jgi:UTP--glucose-1-phosphate uridylyltransferase|nr:NTP transferase domain-containing protein [Coriobacteriales bacterium]